MKFNFFWVKFIFVVLLVITVGSGGYYVKMLQSENLKLKADQEALALRVSATEKNLASLDAIFVKRDEVNHDIRTKIADVTVRIKQEAIRDPASRNFLNSTLPDGLRNAFIKEVNTTTNSSNPGTNKTHPN